MVRVRFGRRAAATILADRGIEAVAGQEVIRRDRRRRYEITRGATRRYVGQPHRPAKSYDIGYLGSSSRLPRAAGRAASIGARSTARHRRALVERPITWEDQVWLFWPFVGERDPA